MVSKAIVSTTIGAGTTIQVVGRDRALHALAILLEPLVDETSPSASWTVRIGTMECRVCSIKHLPVLCRDMLGEHSSLTGNLDDV